MAWDGAAWRGAAWRGVAWRDVVLHCILSPTTTDLIERDAGRAICLDSKPHPSHVGQCFDAFQIAALSGQVVPWTVSEGGLVVIVAGGGHWALGVGHWVPTWVSVGLLMWMAGRGGSWRVVAYVYQLAAATWSIGSHASLPLRVVSYDMVRSSQVEPDRAR